MKKLVSFVSKRRWIVPIVFLAALLLKAGLVTFMVAGAVEASVNDTLAVNNLSGVSYVGIDGVSGIGRDGINVIAQGPESQRSNVIEALQLQPEINKATYRAIEDSAETPGESVTTVTQARAEPADLLPATTEAVASESLQQSLEELFELNPIEFQRSTNFFAAGSTDTLDEAVRLLVTNPDAGNLLVVGHTDSDGSLSANVALSRARAEAVVLYLVENGVESDRLSAEGRGESELLVDPETNQEDKQRNRRIAWEVVS